MKIFVLCDLEGTAGVCDQLHQCFFNHAEYDNGVVPGEFGPFYLQARKLATLELNALVEGALAGGATGIVAWDGHCGFPGGLDVELLHEECQLEMNSGGGGPQSLDGSFDAIMTLGAHARAGTPGAVLAHGDFDGLTYRDTEIGEVGIACAQAGWLGIPLVLVSGDRAAVEEARRFVPEIEGVELKHSISPEPAVLLDINPLVTV